jgi:iron complex outermembrane receptor protein
MKVLFTMVFVHSWIILCAQQPAADSTRLLQEVVIQAYETNRRMNEVPVSVGVLNGEELRRFNNTSVLPAVNIIPGVRMEERSPGSYRFSIRGSSLRSPFGVRNVKAYWNGLPFTDGGGNTYLNLLDFGAIGSIEIIKGPGASLYGAGTGGVLLMKSPEMQGNQVEASAVAGSYGLQRYLMGGQFKNENVNANLQVSHQKSEGYREQTAMKRNSVNADVKFRAGRKGTLTSTVIFSNLFYETPGGLTKAQFEADPSQARPPSAFLGAVEARAAVRNETTFGGIIYDHDWENQWSTSAGVYGGFSAFENPTIRNYEQRDETNFGIRTHTTYRMYQNQASVGGKITFGGEYQYFTSPIAVFNNDGVGNPGAVQVRDEVTSRVGLVFAQADTQLPGDVFFTAGASLNFLTYDFLRLEPAPIVEQQRTFDAVFSPRLAILKKFSNNFSLFASYSDGFSPPSLAEVRPSTNTFSKSLKAEIGNNLEFGARGSLLGRKLSYDLVLYDFRLKNTIIVQRNEEGADYFINAGKTSQRGIEALVSYDMANESLLLSQFRLWASYAYQHYRFKEYVVLDVDYSGNALTGVAPTIFSGGIDAVLNEKFTTNVTVNYVDHVPLDDANSAFAEAYVLLGLRAGWKTTLQEAHRLEIFAGIDNALDEAYSLGNDLNAFGGRYYNPAMPRNYYAGISIVLGSQR